MAKSSDTIRAFIALPLPAVVKETLAATASVLSAGLPPSAVRWVKPEAIHLTVRFLGETPLAALGKIAAALDVTAAHHAPLALRLGEVGCFPNCRRPRVIWVGLTGASDGLVALKADLDQALVGAGWEPETKPFQPHLTLGRIKKPGELVGAHWQADVEPVAWEVADLQLIESELLPDGPRYTVRHQTSLTGSAA